MKTEDTNNNTNACPNRNVSIYAIRNKLVNAALWAFTTIAILAVGFQLYRAKDIGWQNLMAVQIAFVIILAAVTIFHHRLSFKTKSITLLALLYLNGIGALIIWGLIGMGIPFLIITAFLATILYGKWAGILATAMSALPLVILGSLVYPETSYNFDILRYATSPSSWFVTAFSLMLITLTVVISLGSLYNSMEKMITDLDQQSAVLLQTNTSLTNEKTFSNKLIESFPGLFFLISKDLHLIRWNENILKTTGYSPDEIVEMRNTNFFAEYEKEIVKNETEKVFAKGKSVFEASLLTKEGKEIPHLFSGRLCRINDDDYLIGVGIDISERKDAEVQRDKFLKSLEFRNAELESIIQVSSHDLCTPLVNIQGFSEALVESCKQLRYEISCAEIVKSEQKKLTAILNEDIPESLNFIRQGTEKINKLQQGVLNICKLGQEPVNIKTVNVNKLITNVIKSHQDLIDRSHAEVTVGDLPDCKADHDKLSQVFTNIIDNALKYLAPERKGEINITGKIEDSISIYCISDNGIGIAPPYKKKYSRYSIASIHRDR